VGSALGCPHVQAELHDADALSALIGCGDVLFSCAGPYSATAVPLAIASLRAGAHYLDLSGEIGPLQSVRALDRVAIAAGVTLLPAAGFASAVADSLASRLHEALPGLLSLSVGLAGAEVTSRGSVRTMVEQAGSVAVLRGGSIEYIRPGTRERWLDYGAGPPLSVAFSLGDLVTLQRSTGVAEAAVYMQASRRVLGWMKLHGAAAPWLDRAVARDLMARMAELYPEDGGDESSEAVVVAEGSDGGGTTRALRYRTPPVEAMTTSIAVEATSRLLAEAARPGYQTAETLWGDRLAERLGAKLEPARALDRYGRLEDV
jgi:short subunit dehydrogenase-like uncharacterized protein